MRCTRSGSIFGLTIHILFAPLWGCRNTKAPDSASPQAMEDSPPAGAVSRPSGADEAPVLENRYRPRAVEAAISVSDADRASQRRIISALNGLAKTQAKANNYYGVNRAIVAQRALTAADSPGEQLQSWIRLAMVEMDLGETEPAFETLGNVEFFLEQTQDRFRPRDVAEVHFRFGMIPLRHGETQNCCLLHNIDS
jgi:hypothetical protein